ncbi:MAG TPA: hypothetical protein VH396_10425 [Chitinophagaceae bacterium]
MRYSRGFIVFGFVFCVFMKSKAQQFGGNPSSIKWQQINTDTARIIFPRGLDSIAQRIASVTHELQKNYSNTIGNKTDKINIVLQKDATISNAFVALGPYRSEYYLTPPQNAFELGAQNWTDNLAIHEFRHVQQYNNFNIGLSKVMSVLFGENGRALANSASIPDWFFEGDAVYNETLLSEQGRGRLPLFFSRYKSLFDDNRHYSYMQLRNGSLRHYIPGHYELGYLLVAYGREKYGDDFWRKVTHNTAAFKPLFYPLQGAVKKYAGISYNQFVKDAFAFYQKQWSTEDAKKTSEWISSTQKNNVVNYKYPYAVEDGSLLVLKSTYRDIPAIYKLNIDGTESRITVRDIAYDDYFSYNAGKIVYAAYQADVRWGNRDFSVIRILDINTHEEKKISNRTRYFAPDISHDGKKITAVEIKDNLQSSIVVMDEDGAAIKKFTDNDHLIYSYPKFSADDKFLYIMVRNDKGEMGINKINIIDGTATSILPLKNRILGFPVVKQDTLLYSCSNNGRDEIWSYIESQNKNYRMASYVTGLYQACFTRDGKLVASVFTSSGYRLAKINAEWQPVDLTDTLINLYVTKPFNEKSNLLLESVPATHYSVTKYPKFFHPFNFHSWAPYLDYPDYSFNIYGQNILNTLQSQLYYNYNDDEKYHRAGYTSIYGGWYLEPFLDINQTWNRSGFTDSGKVKWNEFNASAGLSLPLNFSGGKQYRNLTLSASYNINNIQWKTNSKKLLNDINYINTTVSYSSQIQKATDQIYPRWAQRLLLQYRGSITGITARQFLATGSFYLPGIEKTHNIVLNFAYQARDTAGKYFFTNNFPFSRGYDAIDLPRVWKIGGNYHFPLLHPDWGFGNIVYFLRIRANAFYDYTDAKSLRNDTHYKFRSYGGEIYFDTKWWNQQPLTFGIRYSHLLDNEIAGLQPNQWEIILPVTILN